MRQCLFHTRLFLLVALFCTVPLASFPQELPLRTAEHAEQLDNFLLRTVRKIADSWNLCFLEFKMAFHYSGNTARQTVQDISSRAELTADEFAADAKGRISDQIDHLKSSAVDSARTELTVPISRQDKPQGQTAP